MPEIKMPPRQTIEMDTSFVLPREIRAVLPNGKTAIVRTTPRNASSKPDASSFNHDAKIRLGELLASGKPSEADLKAFLCPVVAAVFPDADPSRAPEVIQESTHQHFDIVFPLMASPFFGAVEVKNPLADWGVVTSRVRALHFSPERVIHKFCLIAGRRGDKQPKLAMALLEGLSDISALTWDDVVDRLTAVRLDDAASGFEVVLEDTISNSRTMLRRLIERPELITAVEDRPVEQLLGVLLHDIGFSVVEITKPRGDGGKDVIASFDNAKTGNRETYLFECKHWLAGDKVHLSLATKLLGVVKSDKATGGVMVAWGGFGPELLRQEVQLQRQNIHLKDKEDIVNWIHIWERSYGSPLLKPIDPVELLGLRAIPIK